MELDLQPVYPNTLKKKVVWKIKLQKWHRGNLEGEDYGRKRTVERNEVLVT